jgi:hypothetical protein
MFEYVCFLSMPETGEAFLWGFLYVWCKFFLALPVFII